MRFERLDLNLLVALDALLEERNVSLAAQRLFLTQPAVSGALKRLRDFFGDELLVWSGREMILTPKAEELAQPVRQTLMFIRTNITTPASFDPQTSNRSFSIAGSDYVFHILVADIIRRAAHEAPNITFEITNMDKLALEKIERGEVDLVITIDKNYLHLDHPKEFLFEDEHAILCWSESSYRDGINAEQFYAAAHAVVVFGKERHPAFSETFFEGLGVRRRIEIKVASYLALPYAVIGTQRIAVMHRRYAELVAKTLPLCVLPVPFPIPNIREEMQWHTMSDQDGGMRWLRGLIKDQAAQLKKV